MFLKGSSSHIWLHKRYEGLYTCHGWYFARNNAFMWRTSKNIKGHYQQDKSKEFLQMCSPDASWCQTGKVESFLKYINDLLIPNRFLNYIKYICNSPLYYLLVSVFCKQTKDSIFVYAHLGGILICLYPYVFLYLTSWNNVTLCQSQTSCGR